MSTEPTHTLNSSSEEPLGLFRALFRHALMPIEVRTEYGYLLGLLTGLRITQSELGVSAHELLRVGEFVGRMETEFPLHDFLLHNPDNETVSRRPITITTTPGQALFVVRALQRAISIAPDWSGPTRDLAEDLARKIQSALPRELSLYLAPGWREIGETSFPV